MRSKRICLCSDWHELAAEHECCQGHETRHDSRSCSTQIYCCRLTSASRIAAWHETSLQRRLKWPLQNSQRTERQRAKTAVLTMTRTIRPNNSQWCYFMLRSARERRESLAAMKWLSAHWFPQTFPCRAQTVQTAVVHVLQTVSVRLWRTLSGWKVHGKYWKKIHASDIVQIPFSLNVPPWKLIG